MESSNLRLKAALESIRLERLVQKFADEGISDDILDQLKEEDLAQLGVTRMGDRKRLISIFRRMFFDGLNDNIMVEVSGGVLPEESELKGTVVDTFLIGKHMVLQEDWEWVRVWGICNAYDLGAGQANGSLAPVTHVNWYDAVKWCNAKSEHEGLEPVYACEGETYRKGEFGPSGSKIIQRKANALGYRLPLEAEWEWAAIGGILRLQKSASQAATARNESTMRNWRTTRDSIFNELGLYNMTFNIWEWCWDHDNVETAHRIRSRALNDQGDKGHTRLHISHGPDSRLSVLGFRLARNIS
jgi:sulfatase modifying factor 1